MDDNIDDIFKHAEAEDVVDGAIVEQAPSPEGPGASESEPKALEEDEVGSNSANEAPLPDNAGASDGEEDVYKLLAHKKSGTKTKKKNVRKSKRDEQPQEEIAIRDEIVEDEQTRRRRLLDEKMDMAIKSKVKRRRKADEDDLERMQDDRIDMLKDRMIKAANTDVERNSQGLIATEKLKLLSEVTSVLSKADLAISILDNNLLEAVRLWLEPLPDASMPAYQIQKELINALVSLPIKTDHLVASGIGKVMVFYQRSKRTELNLKKIVDQLIGDWTRPILNKSDSYKDRTIQFQEYNKNKFANQLNSSKRKVKEVKTLYEESAERRNRAAIPAARTTAYKIAPRVDRDLLARQRLANGGGDERFKRINQKMNFKKKVVKKNGPSIEGRNLTM